MPHFNDYSSDKQLDILELVHQYEQSLAAGISFFFEAEVFQEIIDYYDEHLQTEKALQAIAYALQQHPFCAQFYLVQAQILMDAERYEAAREALEMGKRYEPTNIEFMLAEVELLQRTKDYEASEELLAYIRPMAGADELQEIELLEANLLEAKQDYNAALRKLERAAQREPNNDWILSRIWLCAEWGNEREHALDIYQQLIDVNPYSYWAWYHLGYAAMELEHYEKAVEAFDYAIVIDESMELPYRDLIAALLQLDQYGEALRYCKEYAAHFELDAEVYELMGEAHEGLSNSVEARACYLQSAQLNVRDGNCYLRLGGCYAKEGDWKAALAAFELAKQADPNNENYYLAIAEAHFELGDSEEAHEYLLQAVQKAPMSAHPWLCYLEFLILERDFELAFEVIDKARQVCDDAFALDCAYAGLLFVTGAFQEAWVWLMRLHQQNAEAPRHIADMAEEIAEHPLWKQWLAELN